MSDQNNSTEEDNTPIEKSVTAKQATTKPGRNSKRDACPKKQTPLKRNHQRLQIQSLK